MFNLIKLYHTMDKAIFLNQIAEEGGESESTFRDNMLEKVIQLHTELLEKHDHLLIENERLHLKVKQIQHEKEDLEVLVETISDHADQLSDNLLSEIEKAQREALTDVLTKIPNRRFFDQHLEMEWKRSMRIKSTLALIMIDIDYFKQYNDYYGHLKGDQTLFKVAQLIQKACHRETDFVARYGGEEFVVIISDINVEGIKIVAERIRQTIQDAVIPHKASLNDSVITVSLGCFGTVPQIDKNEQSFIKLADEQLYIAKNKGRNRLSLFDNQSP